MSHTKVFKKGEIVCDYYGKTYKGTPSDWKNMSDTSYLFCFKVNGVSWYIDASEDDGSYGRLINHSIREANLKPHKHEVKNKFKALVLRAKRDIHVGEILLFDYGDRDPDNPYWMRTA